MIGLPFRVGFCVSGQGRLFRAAVAHRQAVGIQPALLVAGHNASVELEPFCAAHGVPCARLPRQPRPQFDRELSRVCVAARLDLLSLTFDRILPRDVVKHYGGRVINTHMSLLPAFKGLAAVTESLKADVRFAGATIHEVTDEVDGGAIIAQCVVGVRPDDDTASLGRRLFERLRPMYLQVIAWYAAGRVEKDGDGRIRIRDAAYGELPVSPLLELTFPVG
jgi:phosphoribosylglycinamide formyltransferase 1